MTHLHGFRSQYKHGAFEVDVSVGPWDGDWCHESIRENDVNYSQKKLNKYFYNL